MEVLTIFIFILIFLIFGGGAFVTYDKFYANQPSNTPVEITVKKKKDAALSNWTEGECKPTKGNCGIGIKTSTRSCNDGANGGVMCTDYKLTKDESCYITCKRPDNILDWGHPNDVTEQLPLKGWYDFTGQGVPNDFCRWVGESNNMKFACQTSNDPYVMADPNHLTFSSGPAKKLIAGNDENVSKVCPTLRGLSDPDLKTSIANRFITNCQSKCVYDYRNPKTGWTFNADTEKWERIDSDKHECLTNKADVQNAIDHYNELYSIKHSWS